MRFGMSVPPFGPFADPRELAELARTAEECGWDGFFVWDHVVFDATFHPIADPWVALAAVAGRTERLIIGTMVTPLARRRPWVVARQAVSLDHLSQGRFVLGVGLGPVRACDFGWFGEESDLRVRARALDEALEVITGLWSGEPFRFAGDHYRIEPEVTFLPRPVSEPGIPIWVGGVWPNKPPLRRAARWDGMAVITDDVGLTPDQLREALAYVRTQRQSHSPFEVIANGATGDDPATDAALLAEFVSAGATWWFEDVNPWRFGADYEEQWQPRDTEAMWERVRQGPPVSA